MKHETFSRARLEILNYVITFCTNTLYDGKYFPPFSEGSGFESVKIGVHLRLEALYDLWQRQLLNGIYRGLSMLKRKLVNTLSVF
ncbi:MAG: hypothetical protein ACLVL2_03350 [Bacteroides cellulosilyticus]